jgi:hypothetical protein
MWLAERPHDLKLMTVPCEAVAADFFGAYPAHQNRPIATAMMSNEKAFNHDRQWQYRGGT